MKCTVDEGIKTRGAMEKGFDDVLGAIADLHPAKLARNRTAQETAWSSAEPPPDASDEAKGEGNVKGNSNDSVEVEVSGLVGHPEHRDR